MRAHGNHGFPQISNKYYIRHHISLIMHVSWRKLKVFCTLWPWVRVVPTPFSTFIQKKVHARIQASDPKAINKHNNHLHQITICIYSWNRLYIYIYNEYLAPPK